MNTHMVHREGSEGVRVEEKEGGGLEETAGKQGPGRSAGVVTAHR